ncbi:MAG: hypothetical protein ABGZ53_23210 [Fuerstiella sp.]
MKELLLNIERFLRWFSRLTPEEHAQQAGEISEASQAFADELEQLIDSLPDDLDDSETKPV